jgi:hypothetical protein
MSRLAVGSSRYRMCVQEGAGQEQLLPHPERVPADREVGRLAQLDHLQDHVRPHLRDAVELAEELEVPPPGELLEVVLPVRDVPEQRLDPGPVADHVVPADGDRPGGRAALPDEDADGGALAGPVRPEQAETLVAADVDGRERAVVDPQAGEPDHHVGGVQGRSPRVRTGAHPGA